MMTASAKHPLLLAWPEAAIVYDRAWLSLPDGRAGELRDLARDLDPATLRDLPVVVFQTGSADRGQDKAIARWFADRELAFIAPRTHLIAGRPSYESPAPLEVYHRVHELRRLEIDYVLARLEGDGLFDLSRLCIMGLSEGAVAAATWAPDRTCPRVIMAWSMEETYFARDLVFPAMSCTPMLNIIGGKDPFFGAHDSLASVEQVAGHGAQALGYYRNSKIVIYPDAAHRVADVQGCVEDVTMFVDRYLLEVQAQDAGPDQQQRRTE